MSTATPSPLAVPPLLREFRARYYTLQQRVSSLVASSLGDPTVLARLGDELDEFNRTLRTHTGLFDGDEFNTIATNIAHLQRDVGQAYQLSINASHRGRPTVVHVERSGRPGRPRIVIDPAFLQHAVVHRGATKIGRFLGVSRSTVRTAMLEAGLAPAGSNPFPSDSNDRPHHSHPARLSDPDLDQAVVQLRTHYPKAGISMIDGMLRRMGHPTGRARISASLVRVDPVRRVFERVRIKRRKYWVPGPNSLWHHDGQHGLIRWGIVMHGFIDGHSRLVTGLRASNNNRASTVLDVFLRASQVFGVPSRLRGDHGTENIQVAAFMELKNGVRRGSYIWGRSVHNVRIERLWVDVTTQFGAKWHSFFQVLEVRHALDINKKSHIWLLHYLFLPDINADCTFFAESWNFHKVQFRDQPTRSPYDMWLFDQVDLGVRGSELAADELEMFGVDWEGLREASVLASWQGNNSTAAEGTSSWVGQAGPPPDLSEVIVEEPDGVYLELGDVERLHLSVLPWLGRSDEDGLVARWLQGLAFSKSRSNVF